MFRIKRLYIFMLKTFLPLFMMTFFICLFIVMMQFLWKYIDELVGKGLSIDVVAELFFYAALSMVPLALPLAILLASLMTFGNLGEHVELTAMKSSGISLVKVMAPLAVLISGISVGAFFFQNDVLPKSQVQMWTLLFSMRQKSPTLDIPEGAVYSQIPGYNLYVKHKDKETDMLYNMLIYDVSTGYGYPRIVAADSGKLSMTPNKKHLVLNLYHGNWYEDMKSGSSNELGSNFYRRESFQDKEIMIPYNDNFTKIDDESMRSQYIGKNITELRETIDSVQLHVDSVNAIVAREIRSVPVCGAESYKTTMNNGTVVRTLAKVKMDKPVDFDSIMKSLSPGAKYSVIEHAVSSAMNMKQEYEFRGFASSEDMYTIRRHEIELQKKFTLSLACLIFFFIGAPLGAIIRKGGLGTPIVISVLLFIVYYIIDNMGYKLARDGRWPVWEGIWLSSAVLLPLGIFLTHKAVNDSAVFNPDIWMNFIRRITGLHQVRKLEIKEVVINEVDNEVAIGMAENLKTLCQEFLTLYPARQSYMNYWQYGFDKTKMGNIGQSIDELVDYLSNSRDQLVINKAMDYPVIRHLLTYHPTNYPKVGLAIALLLPIGIVGYLIGQHHQRNLKHDIAYASTVCDQLIAILNGNYTREMEYNPS